MRIIACLTMQHDLLLVALAALICVVGALITMRLYQRCLHAERGAATSWIFLGAVAGGSTIWCTHFVAMLAYRPGVEVSYDPALTGVSLAVAISSCALSFAAAQMRLRRAPELGGAVFGAGVSAMHYAGMSAFGANGVIEWSAIYVIVSIILSSLIAAAAFAVATRAKTPRMRYLASAGILVLAIVALHFTGMSAMTITPFAPDGLTNQDAYTALAFAVAGVGLLVLGTGFASYALDVQAAARARSSLSQLAESTIDGVIIARDGRIVEVNAAFETLTGRSRDAIMTSTLEQLGLAGIEEQSLVMTRVVDASGQQIPVEVFSRRENAKAESGLLVYAVRDVRQRQAQERRMAHLARNDSLTGLPNRASFLEHLERCVKNASAERKLALLSIDLNRFKEVNDLHGHAAGDHVLKTLAGRMIALRQGSEFIARLGGDEFVATVTVHERCDALDLAARLEQHLGMAVSYEHIDLVCGASIGIAIFPDDGETTTALMNNADLAMYRAKSSLTEQVCFYEEKMDEVVRARRKVTVELREAIAREQFHLRYQLQANTTTREIVAYEALLRWKHPERGYIPPDEFIPLAEETGLISPIGEWVLRKACAEATTWPIPHRVAVNISAVQLSDINFPKLVHQILLETGLPARRLELEITETALIQDPLRTTHILRQLKALGVLIAMDDFGVGYSSLSTLRAFPFDKIKLDKSFMDEVEKSPQSRAIIRAVLTIGQSLNIPVLAEGVETEQQLNFLEAEGCHEVQGYLLGRPQRKIQDASALSNDRPEDEFDEMSLRAQG